MKKTITVIVASLSFVFAAGATDIPGRYETFFGYQFTRFNTNRPALSSLTGIDNFDANGGSAQFIYNINKWVGVVFDAGAVTNQNLNPLVNFIPGVPITLPSFDTTVTHFVAGPRLTWHNESRFMPYVEAMFGGAYGTSSFRCISDPTLPPTGVLNQLCGTSSVIGPISSRVQVSNTVFALMAGGGLDIKLSKHVAVRPAGFDYYLTRPPTQAIDVFNLGRSDRNNWRYTAGVTFMFGAL
jgi:opacity protein-like surface antigen